MKMHERGPVLLWLRRDLRLADHPALSAAVASGRAVIPVFVHDEAVEALGAAPRFRLGLALEALHRALAGQGSALVLRRGRGAAGVAGAAGRDRGRGGVLVAPL